MTKRFESPKNLAIVLCLALLPLIPGHLIGQSGAVPTRDPAAVALANQALQALAGTTALSDITVQASATYIAGSDLEMGPATLVALGNEMSLVTLNLTDGQRQEIRNGPTGLRINPSGAQSPMAIHNCWVDASWFFPALTLQALAVDPTLGIAYLGPSVWNGVPVIHLQFSHVIPGQMASITTQVQSLSVSDLYLDPKFLWPVALDFNTHPDYDLNQNVPVEIRFGSYGAVSGVQVPFQIQKYQQGTLLLSLTVSSAAVNSGVSPGIFTIPQVSAGGAQ